MLNRKPEFTVIDFFTLREKEPVIYVKHSVREESRKYFLNQRIYKARGDSHSRDTTVTIQRQYQMFLHLHVAKTFTYRKVIMIF